MNFLNEFFSQFHFLRPQWLWAFVPIGLIVLLLFQESKAREGWRNSIAKHLLPYLLIPGDRLSGLPKLFLVITLILMVLALTGPTWNKVEKPGVKSQAVLVIAVDLSRSMLAEDIQPNRLERAKQKIIDLMAARPGTRTALIAFAGTAHLVLPFTSDNNTISYQLESMTPGIMPVQGTRLEAALEMADSILQAIEAPSTILIISDDITDKNIEFIREYLLGTHNRIEYMALATPKGAPIPLSRGRLVRDKFGSTVIAKLDVDNLKQLARIDGVNVTTITLDDSDVRRLAGNIRRNIEFMRDPETAEEDWQDAGIWLVFPIALIVLVWFRRGWMVQWIILLFLLNCSSGSEGSKQQLTGDWGFVDLWLTRDQQGQRLYNQGKFFEAAQLFENDIWKGVALYRSGDFEAAAAIFSLVETPDGYYNLGLAQAELGNWISASSAFESALTLRPDFPEAKENLEYVLKIIREREGRFHTPTSVEDRLFGQSQESEELKDLEGGEEEQTEGGKPEQDEQLSQELGLQPPPDDQMMPISDQIPLSKEEAQDMILRQLSDDPAIFLKRKFQYQIRMRKEKVTKPEETW